MGTDKKSANRNRRVVAATAVAVSLGFAAPAWAGTDAELPAAFTSLESYEEVDATDEAARHAGELIAADANAGPARKPLYRRYHRIKILSFKREVELLKEDVVVKVQSPGKRKSLMMLELKF